ncbi:MAG: hypothetical protein ACOYCD_05600 [Kiritimatiellia bacterium]|jgi:hypothetical protein
MNDYDWLGNGIYFWENNSSRAMEFAQESANRKGTKIITPAVIGAILVLGNCLDLTDTYYLNELKKAYNVLSKVKEIAGASLPENENFSSSKDKLFRKLDCAVIQVLHTLNEEKKIHPYDTVRGVFWEGGELYPNAGFSAKNHIQICVRNINCIKGFFLPRPIDKNFPIP